MNAKKTIQRIAAQNGISVTEAKREMAMAIRSAMNSPDPQIRQRWKTIAPDGKEPTVEEFLEYCAENFK